MGVVFCYVVVMVWLVLDFMCDLCGVLVVFKVMYYGVIIELKWVGELLCVIDGYEGFGIIKNVL